jgi:hypothetical protein
VSDPIKSNALIVNGLRLFLPRFVLNVGGSATNYLDDGEPHLVAPGKAGVRTKPLTTFVLHETGGNTEVGAERSMQQNHLGVHLLLDVDGSISCYADLATEVCWHAGQANGISVGMEVVNEYRPEFLRDPHGPVIPAEWWTWVPKGMRPEYVCPTNIQMRVADALIPWLCGQLGIPYAFPLANINKKKPRITGWRSPIKGGWWAKPPAGVVPHAAFSGHADGWYMHNMLLTESNR